MVDAWIRQTIEGWVSDFSDTPEFLGLPTPAKEYAPQVLDAFLKAACDACGGPPGDIEEADCKAGLLDGVAALQLPASARAAAPDTCAAFLTTLERQGRLGGGEALGRFVRALRSAFTEKTAETVKPIRNPSARIGRNDPCPCGSGKKFKKCCMRS